MFQDVCSERGYHNFAAEEENIKSNPLFVKCRRCETFISWKEYLNKYTYKYVPTCGSWKFVNGNIVIEKIEYLSD